MASLRIAPAEGWLGAPSRVNTARVGAQPRTTTSTRIAKWPGAASSIEPLLLTPVQPVANVRSDAVFSRLV
jgi:hypothetical protein